MNRLDAMQCFVRVAQAGSFAAAAAQSDVARSVVTRQIASLERHLGVKLLARSTRRLHLTAAGIAYLEKCREILDLVAAAETGLGEDTAAHRGPIRITGPASFGVRHLMPLLTDFAALHPGIELEVDLTDRTVDLVAEGVDVAIRISHRLQEAWVVRPLSVCRSVLVAAPGYLERHGDPLHPDDLKHHECLCYSPSLRTTWPLTVAGEIAHVPVAGRIRANHSDALLDAAIRGLGIAYQPTFAAAPALNAGLLKIVLEAYPPQVGGLHAVLPGPRYVPPRVRALVDYLAARTGPRPYWDDPITQSDTLSA